ncbi:MAG: AraC family ligand binding domain-containing protein [Polaromonas sp.]|nr:AraC family ligand binding domain-containing protein [Polaromonas sp.]
MAISHAAPGEVIDVRPLGAALATTRTHALFKSGDLEVIRVVLLAGDEMPPHVVAGEITVLCIEGRVEFTCDAGVRQLAAGELILVSGDEMHALRGIEDASLLLTIALKKDARSGVKA